MSNSDIKDGVYAYVSGTVNWADAGKFTVEVLKEGNRYPDRITVWRPDFQVANGDRVTVKGWFSWRKSKKDERYMDYSINNPELVTQQGSAPQMNPADDTWNVPTGINSDQIPF